MDLRGLTDCESFIEGRQCPSGKCSFRHSDAAQKTIIFCDKWFANQCTDLLCPKRHPKVSKRQSDPQSKVRNALCSSHNTFKCTGQCGFDECNTHFGDQEPLQEHINRGRKKMFSLRSSCSQCNALFFSEQDREEHVCLSAIKEPSSSCQANVPPQNLIKPQYLYGNPSTSLSPSGQGLLNNTDSLAFENPQPGTPSQAPTVSKAEPIGVFWDIQNCQVPRKKSAFQVVQKIRNCYFTGKSEVVFKCVCDTSKEKKAIIEELNKAQVDVVHINANSKNTADDKLKQSLRRFAELRSSPATVILISGDINFVAELSDLRYRHNFHVICLHNAQAQDALLECAHEARRFDQFTSDLPDRKARKKNGQSSELLVHNLPMGKPDALVRNELEKLSANCGGKVVSISGCTAVLKFSKPDSATRARGRMDKEDVLGSEIQVVYSTGSHKTQPMSPKSTPSTLQKGKKDSSCALLDTSGIESTIQSRHTTKRESNPSQTPTDESPDSGDSREENVTNDDLAASGLASLQNFTVLDKQQEGFYLLVTNLDENVSKNELEMKLASVFQEHCEVE